MTRRILLILFCLFTITATTFAIAKPVVPTKSQADSAYAKKDYNRAAQIYEQLLRQGVSPVVFYNLGNAYYRLNDLPRAILNYERALKYAPGNDDARFNLDVCRSKLTVPHDQASGMFFITWTDSLIRHHGTDTWGNAALAAFVIMLAALTTTRLWRRPMVRRIGTTLTIVGFLASAFCMTAAALQHDHFVNERRAVVMTDTTLKTDDAKANGHTLVAGTTVNIVDESPDGRVLVETTGKGMRGWTDKKALTNI